MFLYFIQRKRWLADDKDFLSTFWRAYQDSRQSKDSFAARWLNDRGAADVLWTPGQNR